MEAREINVGLGARPATCPTPVTGAVIWKIFVGNFYTGIGLVRFFSKKNSLAL
jgi:hypothetical protein